MDYGEILFKTVTIRYDKKRLSNWALLKNRIVSYLLKGIFFLLFAAVLITVSTLLEPYQSNPLLCFFVIMLSAIATFAAEIFVIEIIQKNFYIHYYDFITAIKELKDLRVIRSKDQYLFKCKDKDGFHYEHPANFIGIPKTDISTKDETVNNNYEVCALIDCRKPECFITYYNRQI